MSAQLTHPWTSDYQRIEQAIAFIKENFYRQPSLQEIAESVHLSEYHFQRLFSRWVGISPKHFQQYLTKEYAKELLGRSEDLLNVSYQSGLSGPGRLHDLFVNYEAVTPGEYKNEGQGLALAYAFHATPFGECLLATTPRGICNLEFVHDGKEETLLALRDQWRKADFYLDEKATAPLIERIFTLQPEAAPRPLSLFLKGTNFQVKVWEALLKIPAGNVVTYENIATQIGMPRGARAVGNAVAHNPVMYLIPCHRVIRKDGEFGHYRGGATRKMALLGWEMARADSLRVEPAR
jgi:AraC family transcriptional regulator of adaptative response/methylated-DNA-[protein]-cysteine methyltransferase